MPVIVRVILLAVAKFLNRALNAPKACIGVVRRFFILGAEIGGASLSLNTVDVINKLQIWLCKCTLSEMRIDGVKLPGKIHIVSTAAAHGANAG